MSADMAIQIGRDALYMVMLIASPMLVLGLLVGVWSAFFRLPRKYKSRH